MNESEQLFHLKCLTIQPRNKRSIQDCFILQEDLTSLGQREADWQMKFNVAKCHYESDSAPASQTDSLLLLPSQPNFGKRSVSKLPWNKHLW